jgi:DNA-binding NarL/FixJ family response regulator
LENDLREVERQTGMLVAPAPARSGLNLSERTQVLRLHRSGQDSSEIAASLGLPRGEVDLLIKVHNMALEQI